MTLLMERTFELIVWRTWTPNGFKTHVMWIHFELVPLLRSVEIVIFHDDNNDDDFQNSFNPRKFESHLKHNVTLMDSVPLWDYMKFFSDLRATFQIKVFKFIFYSVRWKKFPASIKNHFSLQWMLSGREKIVVLFMSWSHSGFKGSTLVQTWFFKKKEEKTETSPRDFFIMIMASCSIISLSTRFSLSTWLCPFGVIIPEAIYSS